MGCPGNLPASGLAGVVGRLLNPKAANACMGGASVALVACAKSWLDAAANGDSGGPFVNETRGFCVEIGVDGGG